MSVVIRSAVTVPYSGRDVSCPAAEKHDTISNHIMQTPDQPVLSIP